MQYECKKQTAVFDPAAVPEITVQSGDEVLFHTLDCYNGRIYAEDQDLTLVDFSGGNPCAGPVCVKDARRGDTLKVEILSVRPIRQGLVRVPGSCGPLAGLTAPGTRIYPADKDSICFNGVPVPFSPMIGTIGCAPEEKIASLQCGDHGGNMDCKLIKAGAVLYFPVYVEGALFQLGDVHAAMGDGELCGTGLEVPAEVAVRLTLLKGNAPALPILLSGDKWYVIGHGKNYDEANKKTALVMQKLLMRQYGFSETEAYMYMSMQADNEICQGCAPCAVDIVIRLGVPQIAGREFGDSSL